MRCIFFYILFKKLQKKYITIKKYIIIKIKNYKKILKFDYIFII